MFAQLSLLINIKMLLVLPDTNYYNLGLGVSISTLKQLPRVAGTNKKQSSNIKVEFNQNFCML